MKRHYITFLLLGIMLVLPATSVQDLKLSRGTTVLIPLIEVADRRLFLFFIHISTSELI